MLVFPRSSVSNTDLLMANSVGIVDSGYRGELKLRFRKYGDIDYQIGERIGQILILLYPQIIFEATDNLNQSIRGEGGFGSSGN